MFFNKPSLVVDLMFQLLVTFKDVLNLPSRTAGLL